MKGPQLGATEGVGAGHAVFEALHVQVPSPQIDLLPAQPYGFRDPQVVAIHQ